MHTNDTNRLGEEEGLAEGKRRCVTRILVGQAQNGNLKLQCSAVQCSPKSGTPIGALPGRRKTDYRREVWVWVSGCAITGAGCLCR